MGYWIHLWNKPLYDRECCGRHASKSLPLASKQLLGCYYTTAPPYPTTPPTPHPPLSLHHENASLPKKPPPHRHPPGCLRYPPPRRRHQRPQLRREPCIAALSPVSQSAEQGARPCRDRGGATRPCTREHAKQAEAARGAGALHPASELVREASDHQRDGRADAVMITDVDNQLLETVTSTPQQ